ncbi:MAG: hypothetical protein DSY77_10605 [Bacteroidetes bacterium]|nr:MAG: hypothetical protein DSY77_10605 [Bacteroidota bacterium]
MESKEIDIAENIFQIVKNLSSDVKLDLISKISKSIETTKDIPQDNSWKNLFGAWESDKSAEQIIEDIRADRYTNRQIEEL